MRSDTPNPGALPMLAPQLGIAVHAPEITICLTSAAAETP